MRRALLLLAVLAAAVAMTATTATAATPKTTLPDVEDEVMCVSCNVPLNIAESPQAYRQREYIRTLVDEGLSKPQIKDRLVAEYGKNVLALPEDEGIARAVYIVPIVVVLALIATAAYLLPKWRRRTPQAMPATAGATVSDAELRRLDDDLRRFD